MQVWAKSHPSWTKMHAKWIALGEKGASGQNVSIYYVLKLSGWALERIGWLKRAFRGFVKGWVPRLVTSWPRE